MSGTRRKLSFLGFAEDPEDVVLLDDEMDRLWSYTAFEDTSRVPLASRPDGEPVLDAAAPRRSLLAFLKNIPFIRRRKRDSDTTTVGYVKLVNSPKRKLRLRLKPKNKMEAKKVLPKKVKKKEKDPPKPAEADKEKKATKRAVTLVTSPKTCKNRFNMKLRQNRQKAESLTIEEIYDRYFRIAETIIFQPKPVKLLYIAEGGKDEKFDENQRSISLDAGIERYGSKIIPPFTFYKTPSSEAKNKIFEPLPNRKQLEGGTVTSATRSTSDLAPLNPSSDEEYNPGDQGPGSSFPTASGSSSRQTLVDDKKVKFGSDRPRAEQDDEEDGDSSGVSRYLDCESDFGSQYDLELDHIHNQTDVDLEAITAHLRRI